MAIAADRLSAPDRLVSGVVFDKGPLEAIAAIDLDPGVALKGVAASKADDHTGVDAAAREHPVAGDGAVDTRRSGNEAIDPPDGPFDGVDDRWLTAV